MPGPHLPNLGVGTNGPAPYLELLIHEPQALTTPRPRRAGRPLRPHADGCSRARISWRAAVPSDGTSGC